MVQWLLLLLIFWMSLPSLAGPRHVVAGELVLVHAQDHCEDAGGLIDTGEEGEDGVQLNAQHVKDSNGYNS